MLDRINKPMHGDVVRDGELIVILKIDRDSYGCSDRLASLSLAGETCVLDSDYLIATAFTSLNVVWPSRTF